jgi:hypothetical protein
VGQDHLRNKNSTLTAPSQRSSSHHLHYQHELYNQLRFQPKSIITETNDNVITINDGKAYTRSLNPMNDEK